MSKIDAKKEHIQDVKETIKNTQENMANTQSAISMTEDADLRNELKDRNSRREEAIESFENELTEVIDTRQ